MCGWCALERRTTGWRARKLANQRPSAEKPSDMTRSVSTPLSLARTPTSRGLNLGLNITVGTLAARREGDDDDADYLVEQLELVNEALADNGLPEFREPATVAAEKRCDFDMGPYAWLHHLRRLAAHLALRGEL